MAKYYYMCGDCGEDFESSQPQVCCAECLSSNIKGGEIDE